MFITIDRSSSMTTSTQSYPLSVHSWKGSSGSVIIRCARSGHPIATFPLEFILESGVGSWAFISAVVLRLVAVFHEDRAVIRDQNGAVMQHGSPIYSGEYKFEQIDSEGSPQRIELTADKTRNRDVCGFCTRSGVFPQSRSPICRREQLDEVQFQAEYRKSGA